MEGGAFVVIGGRYGRGYYGEAVLVLGLSGWREREGGKG